MIYCPKRLEVVSYIYVSTYDQPSCLVIHGEVAQGPSKLLHSAVL